MALEAYADAHRVQDRCMDVPGGDSVTDAVDLVTAAGIQAEILFTAKRKGIEVGHTVVLRG